MIEKLKEFDNMIVRAFIVESEHSPTKKCCLLFPGVPAINQRNEDIARRISISQNIDAYVAYYNGLTPNLYNTRLRHFSFTNSLKDMLSLTESLLKNYDTITLIGHSWGGLVALYVFSKLVKYKNKFDSIILMAPFIYFPRDIPWLEPMILSKSIPVAGSIESAIEDFYNVEKIFDLNLVVDSISNNLNCIKIVEAENDQDVPNNLTKKFMNLLRRKNVEVISKKLNDDHLFSKYRENIISVVLNFWEK